MAVGQTRSDLDEAQRAPSEVLAQRDDTVLSQEIDAIMARLDNGIPQLQARMFEILTSLRRPIAL